MSDKRANPTRTGNGSHTQPQQYLRDLIYLDFEKCASIFSQVEGGLLRETQSTVQAGSDARLSAELNVGIAKIGSGLGADDKRSQLQSRVLHHDVLDRVESSLAEQEVLLDLNAALGDARPNEVQVRRVIEEGAFYVRAEGWVMLEDYRRMTRIAANFNPLMEFLIKCATDTASKSPEYKEMAAQLEQMRAAAKSQLNRDERARQMEQVKAIERQIEEIMQTAVSGGGIDEWLVQGIMQFIELFKPDQINLRLYPFESAPGFHLLANLKENGFVDGDLGNFSFAYGIKPNVKLTLLGLVTSVPPRGVPAFDPLQEFATDTDPDTAQQKAFEKGFRELFNTFEELEKMVRFTRYPNVTLYPIALYRTIR